jgi:hypothetical protein
MSNLTAKIALLSCLLLVTVAQAANSPFSRGALLIGGGGTYMSISPDNDFSNQNLDLVLIYPTVGYFVSGRMCAGITVMLGKVSLGEDDINASAVGPQLTYYFAGRSQLENYSGRAIPYVTGSALIGTIGERGNDLNIRSFTLGAGAIAMFAKNIGGFCDVNYSFDHFKSTEPAASIYDTPDEIIYDGNRFGVQLGLRLFIW